MSELSQSTQAFRERKTELVEAIKSEMTESQRWLYDQLEKTELRAVITSPVQKTIVGNYSTLTSELMHIQLCYGHIEYTLEDPDERRED